uniref:Insulin receptor substrate 1 n=1 Tax=Strongyloides papillosus TaxID=174720 RepID=A0A0N5B678_STREA
MTHYLRSPFSFHKKKSFSDVGQSSEDSPKLLLKNGRILETEKTITADFAIFPLKEKKNKYKQYFIALLASDIYVYRSSKDLQKTKEPKIIINLKNIFNISFYKDSEMTRFEITIMSDINTYLIKLSDITLSYEWYDSLIEKIRVFRSQALHRDVKPNEFFDIAFDCTMSVRPKMKRYYGNQDSDVLDDLYEKITSSFNITSRVRFCMYYNLVVICNIGIQTTCDGYPPFNPNDYIKFPTNVIRDFGKQEKYIFLRIGRCSETGSGELWFKMESAERAKEAHLRIMELFDSVTERKKSDARKYSSQNIGVRMPIHRERSFTNPISATGNAPLNVEEKNKRTQTWGNDTEEPKKKMSSCSTLNNPFISPNSKNSGRNMSPASDNNIESNNCSINYKIPEDDDKCVKNVKKASVSGLFLKLIDSSNDKTCKNLDNVSYKGSTTSIASGIENLRKVSSLVKGDINTDFCYAEDIRKLSTSAIDSKVASQISQRFNRLHTSPKRQQSFTSTNISPLINNTSNTLLTTDYVVMESVDMLNIPLTNSFSNINSSKESFKLDEIKSYCSGRSEDGFLRSRTNTNVSKNTPSPSERSRVSTIGSVNSDIPPNSRNLRAYSTGVRLNNNKNSLTVSSQFVNNGMYDDECNRKRSYSLGNKSILKQKMQKGECYFSGDFEKHRSRSSSSNTNATNEQITENKIESDDHLEIEFGSTELVNEQFQMLSLQDVALKSNKSSLDKREGSPLSIACQQSILNESKTNDEINFLHEKTFEISTKLPTSSNDDLTKSNFHLQQNAISYNNDDKGESLVDYTYETIVSNKVKSFKNDLSSAYKHKNHPTIRKISRTIVDVLEDNDLLEKSLPKSSDIPSKSTLKDSRRNTFISSSSQDDYIFLEKSESLERNKEHCDKSNCFKARDNSVFNSIDVDNGTPTTEKNPSDYIELSY